MHLSTIILSAAATVPQATASLQCTIKPGSCVADWVDGATRVLNGDYMISSDEQTKLVCAETCAAAGFTVAGVEDSTECHCGTSVSPV